MTGADLSAGPTHDDGGAARTFLWQEEGDKAIRSSAVRVVAFGINLLLSLASAIILVRYLGPSGFGIYSTAMAVVTITTAIFEGGLQWLAVGRFVGLGRDERRALFEDLLGLRIVLTTIAALVAAAFALAAGYGHVLLLATLVAIGGFSLQALQPLMTVPLQVGMRWATVAGIDIATQLVKLAAIALLVILGAGVVAIVGATIPAALASLSLTAWVTHGGLWRARFDPTRWRALFVEQLPFAAAVAVGGIYFRMTLVTLQLSTTSAQTGYFAISARVMEVLVAVPVILVTTAFPVLSRAAHATVDRHAEAAKRVLELSIVVGVVSTTVLVGAARPVLAVFAGSAGGRAARVLELQALALIPVFVAQALGFILLSRRRYGTLLICSSSAMVANIGLTAALGSGYGARGAAIATVATEALLATGLALATRRTFSEMRLRAVVVGVAGVATALITIGTLLDVPSVIRASGALAVYAVLLVLTRTFPTEAIAAFRRPRPPRG